MNFTIDGHYLSKLLFNFFQILKQIIKIVTPKVHLSYVRIFRDIRVSKN
jgi:hypothetical protein